MENNVLKKKCTNNIAKLGRNEKTVKETLGVLSRDLLEYVYQTQDIGMINRLLNRLTPINRKSFVAFVRYHLPWKYDKEHTKFAGKLKGDKLIAKIEARRLDFLKDEQNTFWTYTKEQAEPKTKDYYASVKNAVHNALDKDKGNLKAEKIIEAVFDGGITLNQLMKAAQAAFDSEQEKKAKPNKVKEEKKVPAVRAAKQPKVNNEVQAAA